MRRASRGTPMGRRRSPMPSATSRPSSRCSRARCHDEAATGADSLVMFRGRRPASLHFPQPGIMMLHRISRLGGLPMTLQLSLPAELEKRLRSEAERQGIPPDALTLKLLDEHLPPADRPTPLSALFEQWQEEDESAAGGDADD